MDMTRDLVVIGLGYVGLPLAQEATRSGLSVTGLDVSAAVVDGLRAGHSHVDDLSDSDLAEMIALGFEVTTDPSVIAEADAIVICVPTPLTPEGGPDLGAVLSATRAIADHLRPGQLIVLESTTYPGTTDDEVRPVLEARGLVAGTDFHLAFSPERIDPGNPTFGMRNTPKVVGGHTAACTAAAATFYGRFVDTVVSAKGTREAEMAKLLENTYRHINIALVNEMARFCHELDIDLWDVIAAAKSKPFGFHAFIPDPVSEVTASPSIPTICHIRSRPSWAIPLDSLNWPRRSMRGCPPTSSVASKTPSMTRERPCAGPASCCWE